MRKFSMALTARQKSRSRYRGSLQHVKNVMVYNRSKQAPVYIERLPFHGLHVATPKPMMKNKHKILSLA